ncbi:MAG: TetR/AcrR family transcriptional regulator [Acidimicrobiales bacterium]|mgnify:FL=1|jgi:AcrR family transcriptional regulator|nr:TetR/AcrR family transcriptional regulator [Acidimicrobiales bacterium]
MINKSQNLPLTHGHAVRRSERRASAVDAFIDLVLEHGSAPSPEEVAKRAGVSIASMYRYFETLDELRSDATARIEERFPELLTFPETATGNRKQRVAAFTGVLVALHEKLHPLQLLNRKNFQGSPIAAKQIDSTRLVLSNQIRVHFDLELRTLNPAGREDTVAAISVLTSVESWEQFRRTLNRTPRQTRRAWSNAIDRLLPVVE